MQLKKSILFFSMVAISTLTIADVKRPNILFVCADDMSHASCYGYKFLSTPNYDSIAENGLRFDRMYTPSSKCAPSRAVILTGRNPWQLEGAANHKPVWPVKFKSFVESLSDNGYFAGYTGKGWNPGQHPKNRLLTGEHYDSIKMKDLPTKAIYPSDYSANFEAFMSDKPADKPFFFWYGAKEPHRGYEYKSGVKAGKKFEDIDFMPSFWGNSESAKNDLLDYALEVEYFDQHLGKILDHLKELGELENTLILATGDNAMPFPRYKGHTHEFATRIPFVASWPGHIKNPGRVCEEFASFADIAPTILEAAGVSEEQSKMQPIEGKSLFDFFADKVVDRDFVLTGRERNDMCRPNGWGYPTRSFHSGNFVYMHNFEPDRWPAGTPEAGWQDTDWGPTKSQIVYNEKDKLTYELCFGKRPGEELYDISKDPECLNNLALNPEFDSVRKKMKTALFAELKTQGDPRVTGVGKIFDEYQPERFKEYDKLVSEVARKKAKKK